VIRLWLPLVLLAIGSIRIASTWGVFSQTFDEAFHLACGLQWWEHKQYTRERQHPPLSRIAIGALPYLLEHRHDDMNLEAHRAGNAALGVGEAYRRGLILARAGILPFFWIFCISLWRWTLFRFSPETALTTLLIATQLPPILGHSGLATTDIAPVALLAAFGWRFDVWQRDPGWTNTAWAALTLGLALISKFTALAFAPMIVAVLSRKFSRRHASAMLAALLIALFIIAAAYRFKKEFWKPREEMNASIFQRTLGLASFFTAYAEGVEQARKHNDEGHFTYLLGRFGNTGDWRFFPVAFFFKTPIPVLILLALALRRREALWAWCLGAGAMLILLPSNVNLGIRHALAVYIGVSIAAGVALAHLWATRRFAAVALAAWLTWNATRAHPDYAFWFNEFAGGHPERILAESDIDWGQDLHRAVAALDRRGIAKCRIAYFGAVDWKEHFPGRFEEFWWPAEAAGCTLVSVRNVSFETARAVQAGLKPELAWLEKYEPSESIGSSMRLYLIDKVH
jgi:hypothetical protein